MKKLQFAGVLLQPSAASFITILVSALVIIGVSTWTYTLKNGLLYDFLFGSSSSSELIQSSRSTFTAVNQTVLGNPLLNKVMFFVFWMLVGLVVYTIISGFGASINAADQTVHEMQYHNVRRQQFNEQLSTRIIMRSIASLSGFVYLVFFVKLLLPFSVLCSRIGVSDLDTIGGWFYLLGGFLVLALSLHLWIVLGRFFMLRPRLFGGWDDILADELQQHNTD
jgi:hypothetical protein